LRTKDSVFCCRTFNSILIPFLSSPLSLSLFQSLFLFILDTFNKICILNISQSYIIYLFCICITQSYVYSISSYLNAQSVMFPKNAFASFSPKKIVELRFNNLYSKNLNCKLFSLLEICEAKTFLGTLSHCLQQSLNVVYVVNYLKSANVCNLLFIL